MLTSPNAVAWFAGGIVIYLVLAEWLCRCLWRRGEELRRP